MIYSTIVCNLDQSLLQASLPLFTLDKVDAIEWTFDSINQKTDLPDWFHHLLQEFSALNRLIGHGIYYSLFSGRFTKNQKLWLKQLKKLCSICQFAHITEHFGFMTGEDFHKGTPLSVPFNKVTLQIGIDRLQRLQHASNCPIGIENLAFAFSLEDAKKHGQFLEKLVEPIDGFIILDLHNLYCQVHNFNLNFEQIIETYPLEKVREIHLSGGSWDVFNQNSIRRDTHDEAVPAIVFTYLEYVLPRCKQVQFVTLEQLGVALINSDLQTQFQADFLKIKQIVSTVNCSNQYQFGCKNSIISTSPFEDKQLNDQQNELTNILENATSLDQAKLLLSSSSLANSDWQINHWSDGMLYTSMQIAQKWKNGFS